MFMGHRGSQKSEISSDPSSGNVKMASAFSNNSGPSSAALKMLTQGLRLIFLIRLIIVHE